MEREDGESGRKDEKKVTDVLENGREGWRVGEKERGADKGGRRDEWMDGEV